ncbi:endolytic transglycosylase MltG [Cohnella yongneupensis]|uniref:Endolytic murein transglycosylase n=1 Tax=Cohnella yongneupensis TaxID=425006 RepID=A0ABW0R6Y3_9BACL
MDRDDESQSNGWKSYYGDRLNDDKDDNDDIDTLKAERDRLRERYAASSQDAEEDAHTRQFQGFTQQLREEAPHLAEATTASAGLAGGMPPRQSEPPADRPTPKATSRNATYVPPKKPKVLLWSFLIALGIVMSVGAGALFYLWNGLRPPAAGEPIEVTITPGMRAQKIAELLEENGLIRNAFLFSGWMKLKDEGSRFQAGVYRLTPGMTREEIVAKFDAGEIVAAATIKFTIPEGFTVQQIAARLADAGASDKTKFLDAAKQPALWTGSVWTSTLPSDGSLRYPLEGYLFPDTYEFKRGATEAEIINRMLAELDRKLDQLPEDWQTTLEERGLTVHQLLTIASLIEREVVVDEERPIVSSVIQNRLRKKMPLQIDATIQYLLDKQKERLLQEDLKVVSPYNTYLNAGLPPGPIATPSYKSIEAALYPDKTDYLYYVTKKDGSNTHLFAVTYKQHQKNIQISEKNEKNKK